MNKFINKTYIEQRVPWKTIKRKYAVLIFIVLTVMSVGLSVDHNIFAILFIYLFCCLILMCISITPYLFAAYRINFYMIFASIVIILLTIISKLIELIEFKAKILVKEEFS